MEKGRSELAERVRQLYEAWLGFMKRMRRRGKSGRFLLPAVQASQLAASLWGLPRTDLLRLWNASGEGG